MVLQALPLAAPAPTVGIAAPAPEEISYEANVTVSGTAWGTDFWCNHTDVTALTGNCTCAVIVNGPEAGVALPRGLYDDFDDGSLNTTAWSETTCDTEVSEEGGVLIMNASATSDDWKTYAMVSPPTLGYTDFSADIKIQNYSGEHTAYVELYSDSTHWVQFGYRFDANTSKEGWYHEYKDGNSGGGGWSSGTLTDFHNFRLIYDNASTTVYMYGDNEYRNQDDVTLSDHESRLVTCSADENDSVEAHFDNVRAGYCAGYYISGPIDTKLPKPVLWNVNWTATSPPSSAVAVTLRSSDSPDMDAPSGWTAIGNHGNCSSLAFKRYIQYKVALKGLGTGASPLFQSISIQVYIPVEKVEVSLDGQDWALANGTTWWAVTMTVPDGNRTIHCRATDAVGGTAQSSVRMIVDTVPPTGSLVINDGSGYAGRPGISLTIGWTGPVEVTQMQVANSAAFSEDGWIPYQSPISWNLSDGDGDKKVYCVLRDRYGLVSRRTSANVTLDTTPPTGNLTIESGARMTLDAKVQIALEAADKYGVADMQLSNTAGFEGAEWTAFSPTMSWNLTAGPGNRTVFLRVRDRAGHLSPVASDSILRIAEGGSGPLPVATIAVNDGSGFVTDRPVTLNITVDGGAASWMMLSSDEAFTGCEWGDFRGSVPWRLSEFDGKKTAYGRFATGEGRIFSARAEVILDTVPPEGTADLNGGEPDTLSTSVRLDISGQDENGVVMMRISNSPDLTGASWEPYSVIRNWTLSSGDGEKRVYVVFRDPAGLVSEPAVASIVLDTDRPIPTGTVAIDAGRACTNSTSVSLALKLDEPSLGRYASMMISNFDDFKGAVWEKFRSTREWELLPGDGNKTVHVVFDANRMRSDPASDTIVLDTIAPELPVLDTYNRTTHSGSFWLSGTAEPLTSLSVKGIAVPVGEDGRFGAQIPLEKGKNGIRLVITDPAGNSNSKEITVEWTDRPSSPTTAVPFGALPVIVAVVVVALALVVWRIRAKRAPPAPGTGGNGKAP